MEQNTTFAAMSTDELRDRINAKMADKNLSYGAIAKRCGLARTTVFRFLNGADARGATLDKLKKA